MPGEEVKPVCPPGGGGGSSGEGGGEDEDEGTDGGLSDAQAKHRSMCKESKPCTDFFEKLSTCNDRVHSKSKTAETCLEELIDYVHCVDHCAAKRYFPLLK